MEPHFTAVVGAMGRMGALLVKILSSSGHEVLAVDARQGEIDWPAVGAAEAVFLAVPVPAMAEVLENLGPHTRPDGIVIDICSLKEEPLRLMLEYCRGEVLGCHPLFGPVVENMQGQTVFLSPGRSGPLSDWWRDFLTRAGADVVDMDPAEHDRLMSRVQVLRHLMLFSFGLGLERLGFDLKTELPLAGPWFFQLMEMLDVQLEQGPDLYADLAFNNRDAAGVMEVFADVAADLARLVAQKDRRGLTERIARVGDWFDHGGKAHLDTAYKGGYIQEKTPWEASRAPVDPL